MSAIKNPAIKRPKLLGIMENRIGFAKGKHLKYLVINQVKLEF